jgi:hypothetical protein
MDRKTEFIAAAILDTQATIRAIDVKIATLLVAILAPFANISRIFAHLGNIGNQSPRYIFLSIVVVFLILWILALVALVRAIGAIDNPSQHIINSDKITGAFYAGGLYSLKILDVFMNRKIVKSSTDPRSFAARIPNNVEGIEQELIFELMKIAYIRDIKLNRLNWGLRFSLLWFTLGTGIYLSSKYLLLL